MEKKISNKKIFSSLVWKFMERSGVQGISFIVSILLARILTPKEFGLIALVLIFINLANVFVQSGFNTALIQKKDADNLDFSTVFYFCIIIASILYIILFFSSSLIANFYQDQMLKPVIKVLSIILLFGAVNSVQVAVISREMQFKTLFKSSIVAVLVSGIIGILMAVMGYGIWALVAQQITSQLLTTIIMWFTVKWKPQLQFSFGRLKSLFSYGWKILVASLVNTFYLDLRSLVIGKLFSPEMVGYYNRGTQFPITLVRNIDGSIQSVMLPTYASHQDDRIRVKSLMKRSISTSSFIVMPMMVGLAAVAEPLVKLILTDKWLPCVPILQIYCAIYAIRPILSANIQAVKGLGYSGAFLKIEFIDKTIGMIILIISVRYGIIAIAWGALLSSFISIFYYTYPNVKLIDYKLYEMLKDVAPAVSLSIVMAIIILPLRLAGLSTISLFVLQVLVGGLVYMLLAWLFKIEAFVYLLNLVAIFKKSRQE